MRTNKTQSIPDRPASALAVIELRNALGKTQQELAFQISTAIGTIARWETRGCSGEALLFLARVAREHEKMNLWRKFNALYLKQAKEAVAATSSLDYVRRRRAKYVWKPTS